MLEGNNLKLLQVPVDMIKCNLTYTSFNHLNWAIVQVQFKF